MARFSLIASVCVAAVLTAGCVVESEEQVSIDLSDSTPPRPGLSAAVYQGHGPTVEAGSAGSRKGLIVRGRDTILNLIASAEDSESGVQSIVVWSITTIGQTCPPGSPFCTLEQPLYGPFYTSSEPRLTGGENDNKATALPIPLSLDGMVPRGIKSASIDLSVEAFNHAGLRAESGTIRVAWSE